MSRRRRLGAELRRCREAAGLTQEHVSRQFEWHAAKVTRIETARVSVTPRDVRDLLSLYQVSDQEYRETLIELARSSRERAWWAEYRDILRPDSYIGMEAEASVVRSWEPVVVPGLLQTEAYMRALFATAISGDRRTQPDRSVSLRLARQRRLTGDDTIELFAIIDESVIHRPIGGSAVMAGQLRHLLAATELPNVTLRVLPYRAGAHALLGTSLAMLTFVAATGLDVVYVEGFGRSRHFMREPVEVARYWAEFDRLGKQCLDRSQTTEAIEAVLRDHGWIGPGRAAGG